MQKAALGASVFGPNEVYTKLRAFKLSLLERNSNKMYVWGCYNTLRKVHISVRPKLYFVKLDVQACFDTIEQDKLLNILRNIISEVGSPDTLKYPCVLEPCSGHLYCSTLWSSWDCCEKDTATVCQESRPRW